MLYLTTESDYEDHGNGAALIRLNPATGAAAPMVSDLDYPQFPAAGDDGRLWFACNRDSWLCSVDPAARVRRLTWPGDPAVTLACANGYFSPHTPGTDLEVRVGDLTFRGRIRRGSRPGPVTVWLRVPAGRFGLSRGELYTDRGDPEHPQPGLFALPPVRVQAAAGEASIAVIAQRSHVGQRFPMANPGTAREAPAPGFSESPEAYLIQVRWE
jgi:hypothetical protein